jgi:hypothetical protein
MMMVASAAMTNIRRIWRGQQDKNGQPQAENKLCGRLFRLFRCAGMHFWRQAPAYHPVSA